MNHNGQRGLSSKMIEVIKEDQSLISLLKKPDIFLGIRDEYCNIYYRCASMGRISLSYGKMVIEIHKRYFEGISETYTESCDPEKVTYQSKDYRKFRDEGRDTFYSNTDNIRENIDDVCHRLQKREKIIQQALVMKNNQNPDSDWFCVDLEYVQKRDDKRESAYGRFDIVAVRKQPDENGKHSVAIIEIKSGSSAYAPSLPQKVYQEKVNEKISAEDFDIDTYLWSLGSGILGHMADFYRFEHRKNINRYGRLLKELVQILSNMKELYAPEVVDRYFPEELSGLSDTDFSNRPEFYIVTLCDSNKELAYCVERMKNYLRFKNQKNPSSSIYNVSAAFSTKLEKNSELFSNYRFLFSLGDQKDAQNIDDILNEKYFKIYDWNSLVT